MANNEASWLQRHWWVISITAVIALLGYSAAWFVTAALMKLQTAQFLAAQRNGGVIVNTGLIGSSGFPGRVRVTIPDVAVAAPIVGGGWTWQTKRVGIAAWPLTWRKLDLDLDGTHRLAGMATQLDKPIWITAAKARGHLELDGAGRLVRSLLTAEDARVALSEGGEVWLRAGSLRAAGHLVDGPATPQGASPTAAPMARLELEARDVTAPKDLPLPSAGPVVRAALSAEITGRWTSGPLPQVLEAWRGSGGTLEVREAVLDWPPVHIAGSGTLALDQGLQPMGSLSIRMRGGEDVLDLMISQGAMNQTQGQIARAGLALLSRHDGAGVAELDVPLSLQDRQLSAGPFTVGQVNEIGWPRIVVP